MYQIIYDFFAGTLFAGAPALTWQVGGQSLTLEAWLSHSATIITLVVLALVAFKFVWWLVRLVARGFTLRG